MLNDNDFSIFSIFLLSDGELNVLDDILTEVPEQDDELYNPESEQDKNEKKGMEDFCYFFFK